MRLVVALLFVSASAAYAAEPVKILVTTFAPFGGSLQNNTQAIGAELKKLESEIGPGVQLSFCHLPVVFDEASQVAWQCIRKEKPDLVLSLGEAACSIQIETAATNLDHSPKFPDNAGNRPDGRKIDPNGPDRVGFAFPVDLLYCGLSKIQRRDLEVSNSPGSFVCNNQAYHMANELKRLDLPFTFIHVPNSTCAPRKRDPRRNARFIAKMLANALPSVTSVRRAMPATREEAEVFSEKLRETETSACRIEFADRLVESYEF